MSEIAIKPWMRSTDETAPVPNVVETTIVYHALRARVEAEFKEVNQHAVLHRAHQDDVCETVIELETDDDEIIEYTKRKMPGVIEHEVAITSAQGIRNAYVGSSLLQLVNRVDTVMPNTDASVDAELHSMDNELDQLLREAAGEQVPEVIIPVASAARGHLTTLGVTVGQPEMEHFLLYLSDETVE